MWLACCVTLVYICHWSNRPAEAEYMTVYFHCYRGISSSLEASFRTSNDKLWAHALSASFTWRQRILVINIFAENKITINWHHVKHHWADLAKIVLYILQVLEDHHGLQACLSLGQRLHFLHFSVNGAWIFICSWAVATPAKYTPDIQ